MQICSHAALATDGEEKTRAPPRRRRARQNAAKSESVQRMRGGRTPAALHAGRSGPRDRLRRPSRRRKLSERPASEAQPARPSAVLAPSRVQRRGVEARRNAPCVGARSVSDEPGERPERRVSAARYPVSDVDKDRLSLVVLSSGVQEGRPFFCPWHFGPNLPRFGKLDAQTRRGIPATGDAKRRRSSRDPRDAGRR